MSSDEPDGQPPPGGDFSDMRRDYSGPPLTEDGLARTWLEQFEAWFADADGVELEPNAMVLATADERGRPSARTVLLKGVDAAGFLFFTNLLSRKGRDATGNPWGSLVFPWLRRERQVVVLGAIETVGDSESDRYFADRPHGARLGALASRQSEVIDSREVLEQAMADLERRFPPGTDVPRPEHWRGLRLVPDSVEFWQGRPNRLHDRLRYQRSEDGSWSIERLSP